MKLLVLGASGGCGRHLVDFAQRRGYQVRAVVRPGSRFAAPSGVDVREGNLLDEGFLFRAVEGMDVVASALGPKRRNPKNPWSPLDSEEDFTSRSAALLVKAMKTHGVQRVVAISASGVGDSYPPLNWLMKGFIRFSTVGKGYRDLTLMEEAYRQSGLDWLAVRPTRLTDGRRTDQVRIVDAFTLNGAIPRADVAAFMLDSLEATPFSLRTPSITVT
jgi:uncharacterized protein YbjT (DUF2867 family)